MNSPSISLLCQDAHTTTPSGGTIILRCQDVASSADAQDGDSGAPVFRVAPYPLNGDVKLYGILWGEDNNNIAYSPIDQIQYSIELGALNTCAPGFSY